MKEKKYIPMSEKNDEVSPQKVDEKEKTEEYTCVDEKKKWLSI